MTTAHTDTWDIIEGIDVDHIDDRPDDLEHVVVEEGPGDELRAVPFTASAEPPGYVEIDVDLMAYDDVCRYVETATDDGRRIDFTRIPTWPTDGPTATPNGW